MGKQVAEGTPAERVAAINTFMVHNQKLVYSRARKNAFRAAEMDIEDLMQEGNCGLHRATEKFDYKRGFRFTTYATAWIDQAIHRSVEIKDRTVRVPTYLHGAWSRLRQLRKLLGRDPTVEEALEANITKAAFKGLDNWMQRSASLDTPLGDDLGSQLLVDTIPDDATPADRELVVSGSAQLVADAVATLDERTQRVITLRFGLGGYDPVSLETVGKELGVTRERIRQIEQKALRRLLASHPHLKEAWAS